MSDNAHFADAFNYLIYDGEPVIDPMTLSPLDTTEIVIPYGNEAREPEQKYRDVLKLWQAMTDGEAIYAVLGSEIQAKVHYAMPVKDMLYDAMHYAKQVEEAKKSYRDQDSADLINVVTGSELKYEVKGGRVNMCTAIDEMRKESRSEGFIEALASLVKEGILTLSDAAKRVGLTPAEFQARMTEMK